MDIERVTTETAMTGTKMNDLSKPGTSFFLIYPTYCYLDVALVDLRGVMSFPSATCNNPIFNQTEVFVILSKCQDLGSQPESKVNASFLTI